MKDLERSTRILHLRPARFEDRGLIWRWANESGVRAASFHPEAISWEEHSRWFTACLQNEHCIIFIAEDEGGKAVGQVRFERTEKSVRVSISVDPTCRSRGYGSSILREGLMVIAREQDVRTVHACVKNENAPSIRLFLGCGFVPAGTETIEGFSAVHLVWTRKA